MPIILGGSTKPAPQRGVGYDQECERDPETGKLIVLLPKNTPEYIHEVGRVRTINGKEVVRIHMKRPARYSGRHGNRQSR
jgi:hypothetical protein